MNEQFRTSPEHISKLHIADVSSSGAVCQCAALANLSPASPFSLRMPAALLSLLGNKASDAKTRHQP